MDSSGLVARAGRLAAQFAQRTTERVTAGHPAAAAWEMRLAARRGAASAMPRLAASLHRLISEASPRRDVGRAVTRPVQAGGVPPGETRAKAPPRLSQPPELRSEARPSAADTDRRPLRPLVPAGVIAHRGAFLASEAAARAGRRTEKQPVIPHGPERRVPLVVPQVQATEEPALRNLPPARLRETLVRQGGAGEMLASRLREKLRPHLKFDPAMARLHRGAAAGSAARALNAEAFTIGPDVFFGAGRYQPEVRAGLGLLAHELTHVGQQTAMIGDRMRFFTPQGGDAMEREAQQTAAEALAADDREKTNRTGGALHQASGPPKPALAFALSSARTRGGSGAIPAQKATEESGEPGAKVAPAQADARAVTDRVYDLMKQEIALGRERGGIRRRG